MTQARIINDIKYFQLNNKVDKNLLSLEDKVYFTLRDIFMNVSEVDFCIEANVFTNQITGSVDYEDRKSDFQYTCALNNKLFVYRLNKWFKCINESRFDFYEIPENADDDEKTWYYDMKNLITFDDWWSQFEELKLLINHRLNELENQIN